MTKDVIPWKPLLIIKQWKEFLEWTLSMKVSSFTSQKWRLCNNSQVSLPWNEQQLQQSQGIKTSLKAAFIMSSNNDYNKETL